MAPKLSENLKQSLNEYLLLDPSLRGSPEQNNPWAVYIAWGLDWLLAFAMVSLAINSWTDFIAPFGVSDLPNGANHLFDQYGQILKLALTPLVFFTINFMGISLHGMTPGQRLFKHRVECHTHREAMMHAFAVTVSIALMGLPILANWVDAFSFCQTVSQEFVQWNLIQEQVFSEKPIVLVDLLAVEETQEWKEAA